MWAQAFSPPCFLRSTSWYSTESQDTFLSVILHPSGLLSEWILGGSLWTYHLILDWSCVSAWIWIHISKIFIHGICFSFVKDWKFFSHCKVKFYLGLSLGSTSQLHHLGQFTSFSFQENTFLPTSQGCWRSMFSEYHDALYKYDHTANVMISNRLYMALKFTLLLISWGWPTCWYLTD